jgi:hypothetical protein
MVSLQRHEWLERQAESLTYGHPAPCKRKRTAADAKNLHFLPAFLNIQAEAGKKLGVKNEDGPFSWG